MPPGPPSAVAAAAAADLACAAAATPWAIWALFTTLEKELRNPPPPEATGGAWDWLGATGGCRLSVAGEAGVEVEEEGVEGLGAGLCRSIM